MEDKPAAKRKSRAAKASLAEQKRAAKQNRAHGPDSPPGAWALPLGPCPKCGHMTFYYWYEGEAGVWREKSEDCDYGKVVKPPVREALLIRWGVLKPRPKRPPKMVEPPKPLVPPLQPYRPRGFRDFRKTR